MAVVVVTVALSAVTLSSMLNHEVAERLATVPPSSTSPTTTIPAPTTTIPPARVLGARLQRPTPTSSSTTSTTIAEPPVEFQADTPSELITELEKLPVDDEHTGDYSRAAFGFYKDADRDHCDTRAEVFIAEATELVMNKYNCNIQSGKWFSPFDAQTSTNRAALHVEHLVALQEAWESGAWQWTDGQRNTYLNDLAHAEALLVVTDASHDDRADRDPGEWLPSNEPYRCDYLRSWVYLKTVYKLSVDPGERESIAASALHC